MKRELFLYAAVSALALAVDVAFLYFSVVRMGMPEYLAAAISYAAGLVVHYLLSVRYVFAYRRLAAHRHAEALMYALTGAIGIALSACIVYVGGLLGRPLMVSKLTAIVITFVVVFMIRKLTLFSTAVGGWKQKS